MVGQIAQIYVRERVRVGTVLRVASVSDRGSAVSFIGAGTPAEVGVRRAIPGLQLDGVPRSGGLRRVRNGHVWIRAVDPAYRHE